MTAQDRLAGAVRLSGGRILSALATRFRDLDLAEEAFGFACVSAVEAWQVQGSPRDPAAWLYAAARRRALDLTRRAKVRSAHRPDSPPPQATPEELAIAASEPIPDERLRLIFTCCHPALAAEARIALTLRVICGLSVARLARAFLTTEIAMTQRLTRAKQKIAAAKIPFVVPDPEAWSERLSAVLAAVEIAYAQAYEDGAGTGETSELAGETLRLSRLLCDLMPHEPEVLGLAATIRLAEARRSSRVDSAGRMVPLADQDPRLWDETLLGEAVDLLQRAAEIGRTGPQQLIAAIHAAHASRKETRTTPWTSILTLYDSLVVMRPSPIAEVNRAIALSQVHGAAQGLSALYAANADGRMHDFAPFHVAHAALAEQGGLRQDAILALNRSLDLVNTAAERDHLDPLRTAL